MSLDGYIATLNGEYDWIIMDPMIDFAAFFKEFDTVLMGRKTFEIAVRQGSASAMPDMEVFVFSSTLRADDYPDITIIADGAEALVRTLKAKPGKDAYGRWRVFFRSLLDAKLADTIEIGVMPVLLGQGIPLLSPGDQSTSLTLTDSKTLPSDIVMLTYKLPDKEN